MRVSFGDEVSGLLVSPVFGKSMRHTDGLRRMWVDDCQFTTLGEELSPFVSRQTLSTCVSEPFSIAYLRF